MKPLCCIPKTNAVCICQLYLKSRGESKNTNCKMIKNICKLCIYEFNIPNVTTKLQPSKMYGGLE